MASFARRVLQVHVEMGSVLEVYHQKVHVADRTTSLSTYDSTALSDATPPPPLQAQRHFDSAPFDSGNGVDNGPSAPLANNLMDMDAPDLSGATLAITIWTLPITILRIMPLTGISLVYAKGSPSTIKGAFYLLDRSTFRTNM